LTSTRVVYAWSHFLRKTGAHFSGKCSNEDIANKDKAPLEAALMGSNMPADDGVRSGSVLSRIANNEWIPPGLFFIALGCAALWVSRDYPVGTLNRMGPGFFPRMLSFGMIGLGALIVLRGLAHLARTAGVGGRLDRSLLLIPFSIVVFGFSIEPLGLVVALALSLAVAGAAHREARLKEVALTVAFLIALSVLIFVVVLNLPLNLWPDIR
jgi:hypothetical protein